MHTQTKNISDQDIFAMIAENNQEGWGRLYDKYAPAMYGIICKLTGNRSGEVSLQTITVCGLLFKALNL